MKRTQRNLLIILSVAALLWLVLRALPPSAALGIAVGLFAAGSTLCVWGRDFLIGRYRMKQIGRAHV